MQPILGRRHDTPGPQDFQHHALRILQREIGAVDGADPLHHQRVRRHPGKHVEYRNRIGADDERLAQHEVTDQARHFLAAHLLFQFLDAVADVGSKEARIERDDRLALAIEHFQHARFQGFDFRLRLETDDLDRAVGLVDFPFAFARRGGGEHDVGRADPVADLAQDRLGDFPDLRRAVQVGLVDHMAIERHWGNPEPFSDRTHGECL